MLRPLMSYHIPLLIVIFKFSCNSLNLLLNVYSCRPSLPTNTLTMQSLKEVCR
jgi:hypothetical protein